MARRHHYRKRVKQETELDITTFLNLMVVLVPFLLITAVFSRITVVELDLPSAAGEPLPDLQPFRVEVIVREQEIQISDGTSVIEEIPNLGRNYDLQTLSNRMVNLKQQYADITAASILLEPQIPYDYLIQVMDAVRTVEIPQLFGGAPARAALFPDISIGEAP